MNIVLDASVALSWLFERKDKEEQKYSNNILTELKTKETWVPEWWHLEITNVLLVAERRKEISEAQTIDFLTRLSLLPIKTDHTKLSLRREPILLLAREHKLTSYDAAYLDLALTNNATLATFDSALVKAMHKAGGKLFA